MSSTVLQHLWAPWRSRYVSDARRLQEQGCLFCGLGKAEGGREVLRLLGTEEALVVLNLFPYATGHLMVAPRRHHGSPTQAPPAVWQEVAALVVYAERVLRQVYRPDGLNVGMNIGESAGAGVPHHFHVHLVPRWAGDTNFMTALADTRVHPESLETTYEKLEPFFANGPLPLDDPRLADSRLATTGPQPEESSHRD